MQDQDTNTTAEKPTLPFSPLTESGLAIQINDRASALTYAVGAGRALDPNVVAEARRVYAMCVAHSDRIVAILGSVAA